MTRGVLASAMLLGCRPPNAGADGLPARLTVVAMNDFHGALYETEHADDGSVVGGLPWLAGALDVLRAADPNLLVLDGGDLFQGTWPVNASKGLGAVEAFDLLRVDAAAVGNHDFDYGPGGSGSHPLRGALYEAAERASFHWLTANVSTTGDGGLPAPWAPPGIQPYALIERAGVKIGVIGLTTTETPQTTLLRHVEDLRFGDPVQAVRALAPELRAAGAQVVAVLGHLTGECAPAGYFDPGEPCLPDGEIGRLLTELPRGTIDVLVAGHGHTLLAERWDDTFVVESRARGHALGIVDLVVGPDGVDADASAVRPPWPLLHGPSEPGCSGAGYDADPQDVGGVEVHPNLDAVSLVRALEGDAGSLCDPVACTEHRVLRSGTEEAPLGNLVADAMRDAFRGADLAVTNSGGLRADFPMGTVRREHVHELMPFDNRLLLVEMTGAQVRTLFRIGSSGAHGVLQVSGGSYAFDPSVASGSDIDGDGDVAEWERDRLCEVRVTAAPVVDGRAYRVVTTDFLFEGGDHLGPAFEGAQVIEDGPLLREQLVSWLGRRPTCLDAEPLVNEEWRRVTQSPCRSAPPTKGGPEGLLDPSAAEEM